MDMDRSFIRMILILTIIILIGAYVFPVGMNALRHTDEKTLVLEEHVVTDVTNDLTIEITDIDYNNNRVNATVRDTENDGYFLISELGVGESKDLETDLGSIVFRLESIDIFDCTIVAENSPTFGWEDVQRRFFSVIGIGMVLTFALIFIGIMLNWKNGDWEM